MMPSMKRNIIFYFLADINVFVSVYLSFFTLTWMTFLLTNSSAALGVVGFAENIPFLLFSIYGGVLADRHDRRKILLIFNSAFIVLSVVTLVLVYFHALSYPFIFMLSFLMGGIFSLYYPSMLGYVKDIVTDPKIFPRVMGAAASNAKLGQIFASSSFSYIYGIFSAVGTFLAALISNVIALIAISLVKRPAPQVTSKGDSVLVQVTTGMKYVLTYKPILAVILLSTIISTVFGFVTFQLPVIDSDFLKGGSSTLGILYLAGAAGGLSSGIYLGRRKTTKNLIRFLVVCTFVAGVSITGLAFSRTLWVSFICASGVDFSFIAAMGIGNTVIQMFTEDTKRGRVLGINTMFSWGVMSLLIMLFGSIAKSLGMENVLIIIGAMSVISGIVYIMTLKRQRPVLETIYRERSIPPDLEPI